MRVVEDATATGGAIGREKSRVGFTLVEVLTVIALLGILAALIFPVLSQVREASRKATCYSNLRQLTKAWLMYNQDYDGRTPGGAYTRFSADSAGRRTENKRFTALWALLPYLRAEKVFICPTRLGWDFSTNNPNLDTHRPRQGSYASNYQVMDIHESQLDRASDLIVFCDSYNPWQDCYAQCGACTSGCSSLIWDRIGRGSYQGDSSQPSAWHNGGICSAFADGHVKWLPLGKVFYRNWVRNLPRWDSHYSQPITQDW